MLMTEIDTPKQYLTNTIIADWLIIHISSSIRYIFDSKVMIVSFSNNIFYQFSHCRYTLHSGSGLSYYG